MTMMLMVMVMMILVVVVGVNNPDCSGFSGCMSTVRY